MSAALWVFLVVLLVPLAAFLDLFVIRRGIPKVRPDGKVRYYRKGSWVNRLTGVSGNGIRDTIHLRKGYVPKAPLLCHENRHTDQQEKDRPANVPGASPVMFVLKDRISSAFAETIEADARAYATAHKDDPYWTELAKELS